MPRRWGDAIQGLAHRVKFAAWRHWRLGISVTSSFVVLLGLFWIDPTGADAAELFRYPLQLNGFGLIAAVAATAVAFPLTRILRFWGWHPRVGIRWVWMLVITAPLAVTLGSIIASAIGMVMPANHHLGSQLATSGRGQILAGISAVWLSAFGFAWLVWAIHSLIGATQSCLCVRQLRNEALLDANTRIRMRPDETAPSMFADVLAYCISLGGGDSSDDACLDLSLQEPHDLYTKCGRALRLSPNNLPQLVVTQAHSDPPFGPLYVGGIFHRTVNILPDTLTDFCRRVVEYAHAAVVSTKHGPAIRAFVLREWDVQRIAALLVHELGHHLSRENYYRAVVETVKVLFPAPCLLAIGVRGGAFNRLLQASEYAADADAFDGAELSPALMARPALRHSPPGGAFPGPNGVNTSPARGLGSRPRSLPLSYMPDSAQGGPRSLFGPLGSIR